MDKDRKRQIKLDKDRQRQINTYRLQIYIIYGQRQNDKQIDKQIDTKVEIQLKDRQIDRQLTLLILRKLPRTFMK